MAEHLVDPFPNRIDRNIRALYECTARWVSHGWRRLRVIPLAVMLLVLAGCPVCEIVPGLSGEWTWVRNSTTPTIYTLILNLDGTYEFSESVCSGMPPDVCGERTVTTETGTWQACYTQGVLSGANRGALNTESEGNESDGFEYKLGTSAAYRIVGENNLVLTLESFGVEYSLSWTRVP